MIDFDDLRKRLDEEDNSDMERFLAGSIAMLCLIIVGAVAGLVYAFALSPKTLLAIGITAGIAALWYALYRIALWRLRKNSE